MCSHVQLVKIDWPHFVAKFSESLASAWFSEDNENSERAGNYKYLNGYTHSLS